MKTLLDVPVDEDLNSDSLEVLGVDPKKKSSLAFFNWFALGDNNESVDDGRCSKLEKQSKKITKKNLSLFAPLFTLYNFDLEKIFESKLIIHI